MFAIISSIPALELETLSFCRDTAAPEVADSFGDLADGFKGLARRLHFLGDLATRSLRGDV
jgi:hypothetical protein